MNKKLIIALIAFVVVVALALGIYFITRPDTQEGVKTITVVVLHGDGTEKKVIIETNAEFLEKALLDEGILKAEHDENGLYNTVDGETVDWEANQSWWRIYDSGAEAQCGVKEIPVIDGREYRLEYTIGF